MLGMTAVLARVFSWLCHRSISDIDRATAMRAPPVSGAAITNLILELVIVAGFLYGWCRHRWPRPVWLIGAAVIMQVTLGHGPFSATPVCQHFID